MDMCVKKVNTMLRTVRDERDVKRYADFHTTTEGEVWGITVEILLHHHPEISYDDFLLVEDKETGELVSSVCLIPWHIRYGGVPLTAAMLEMVITHREYRGRGLVRDQINRFHQMVDEQGYDFSLVWGIPYFYRQFGYSYAIDLHACADSLPATAIPEPAANESSHYQLHEATLEDIPVLMQLHDESMAALELHETRDAEYWQFMFSWMQFPVQLVEDERDGAIVGYVCIHRDQKTGKSTVLESALAGEEAAMFVLRRLKAGAEGCIEIRWPGTSTLLRLARSLGSAPLPVRQWYIRIPDMAALLTKIGPVFERRIANSDLCGLTTQLTVNLFCEAFRLQFEEGKLVRVYSAGLLLPSNDTEGGDILIPRDAFVRLLFGYRQLDELRDAWPDTVVKSGKRYVAEVLFPKMNSFFSMPWHYHGPTGRGGKS